jgi:LPXTG-motif cell wall-anchored protein
MTGGLGITAHVRTTASGGATLQNISYDFGDSSQKLITDKTTVSYTYGADGTYVIRAVPSFMVDGRLVTAESANCVKSVTFEKHQPVPTPSPELPNTGPGNLIGLFAGTTILGSLGYYLFAVRRRQ